MLNNVEVKWLQIHLPHLKPLLVVGGCYRPSASSQYLDNMCEMLDNEFVDSDGSFITKPTDIANYFNDFFIGKMSKLRHDMPATNADTTRPSISDLITKDKHCRFEF